MEFRVIIAAALLLAGCGGHAPQSASAKPVTADWRRVATATDLSRLRDWRTAFVRALDEAKADGKGEVIAQEGALLDPDAALDSVALSAGQYRCRVIKLGANGPGMASFTVYPAFDCAIRHEGNVESFAKTGGSQRPVGLIFDDSPARKSFSAR